MVHFELKIDCVQSGKVNRAEYQRLLLQYFFSNNIEDAGNFVFGMLPDDIAKEPISYNAADSSANEAED